MTSVFVHTDFIPGDKEGFGLWRAEHTYEHERLNLLCRNLVNPRIIPEYDILSWNDDPEIRKDWLEGHTDMHQALRDITGVTGVDLNLVDWNDAVQLLSWLENHSSEHAVLDQILGV